MNDTQKQDSRFSGNSGLVLIFSVSAVLLISVTIVNIIWLPDIWREFESISNAQSDSLAALPTEAVERESSLQSRARAIILLLPILEAMMIILVAFLVAAIFLTFRQAQRNKIALGHLAHSIKSPVARLRLNADTLLEGRVASVEEEMEGLESINMECIRLEQAIRNSMLSLTRGKRMLQFETCSLSEIVVDAVSSWENVFKRADLELLVDHKGGKMSGRFDPALIRIMMDNLIDNALHFSRLKKSGLPHSYEGVNVRLRRDNGNGIIMVDDTGIGIPPTIRNKIFKRFYRGRSLALTNSAGLGLGLTMVKKIVRAHGGSVWAEENPSIPGQYPVEVKGARLIVELPVS